MPENFDMLILVSFAAASIGVFTTLLFFICGSPCGCSSPSRKTLCLSGGLAFASMTSLLIWFLASLFFLLGGHFNGFLCKPLYAYPNYTSIRGLEDIFFQNGGTWSYLLQKNDVNVGFAQFLQRCNRNESIFEVFGIKLSNGKRSNSFTDLKSSLTFNGNVKILSTELQEQLQGLSLTLSLNTTKHRIALAQPITRRDLNSFLDQLNTIARKLSDRPSVKRVENLAYKIKNVVEEKIKPLVRLRDQIVYNITSLEILIVPLNKELNQTMSHLKTIQFFFDNQGSKIAAEVIWEFWRIL